MKTEREKFLDRIKVDREIVERTNEVGRSYNSEKKGEKLSSVEGGRERGDEGPGRMGRESGYKSGNSKTGNSRVQAVQNASVRSTATGERTGAVQSAGQSGLKGGEGVSTGGQGASTGGQGR